MKLKPLSALVLSFLLSSGSLGAFAQQDNGSIKQDTKDAAHSTGKAAKRTGHDIKKGAKKAVNKSAHATKRGAAKIEGKTEPTPTPK